MCLSSIGFSSPNVHSTMRYVFNVFINRTNTNKRPILLTSHGRGVAVMQGFEEFEKIQEEMEFLKAVTKGMFDIKKGKVHLLESVKAKFGF